MSSALNEAVDTVTITDIDAPGGDRFYHARIITDDGAVWWILKEGITTGPKFGIGDLLPQKPHPKWRTYAYLVPHQELHSRQIQEAAQRRRMLRLMKLVREQAWSMPLEDMEAVNEALQGVLG